MSANQELESEVTDLNQLRNELLNDLLKKNTEASKSGCQAVVSEKTCQLNSRGDGEKGNHDDDDDDDELEFLRLEALKAKRSLSKTSDIQEGSQELEYSKKSAPGRFRYDRESDAEDEDEEFEVELDNTNESIFEDDDEDQEEASQSSSTRKSDQPEEENNETTSKASDEPQPSRDDNTKEESGRLENNGLMNNFQANYQRRHPNGRMQDRNDYPSSSNMPYSSRYQTDNSRNNNNNYISQSNDLQQSFNQNESHVSSGSFDLRNLLSQRRSQNNQYNRNRYQSYTSSQPFEDKRTNNDLANRTERSPSPLELSYSAPITKPIEVEFPPRSRFQKFQNSQFNFKRTIVNDTAARNDTRRARDQDYQRGFSPANSVDKSHTPTEYDGQGKGRNSYDRDRHRSQSSERPTKSRRYSSSRSTDEESDESPSRSRKKLRSAIVVAKSSTNDNQSSSKSSHQSSSNRTLVSGRPRH